ncbi:RNA-directed DNA polymerase from mobile element jockey, partial [Elysia marginata]
MSLVCLYRPPPSKANKLKLLDFLNEIEEHIVSHNVIDKCFVFMGDFNLHYETDKPEVKFMKELFSEHCMTRHVLSPTHARGHIIDWIVTSKDFRLLPPIFNINKLVSDHHLLYFDIPFKKLETLDKKIVGRDFKKIDIFKFKSDLRENLSNPEAKTTEEICERIQAAVDKHAPLTARTVRSRKASPWYNLATKAAKQDRRKAERKWIKTGLETDRNIFLHYKKQANIINRKAKTDFYSEKFSVMKNSKDFFSLAKDLL